MAGNLKYKFKVKGGGDVDSESQVTGSTESRMKTVIYICQTDLFIYFLTSTKFIGNYQQSSIAISAST